VTEEEKKEDAKEREVIEKVADTLQTVNETKEEDIVS